MDNSLETSPSLETPVTTEPNLESAHPAETPSEAAPATTPDESAARIKIGDQSFATQAEALAYANKLVEDQRIADAYSQGVRDAAMQARPTPSVTPPAPEAPQFDAEKYWSDPAGYTQEIRKQAVQEAVHTIEQKVALKEQNDRLWREFTERHPQFADFRGDVEAIANENSAPLQAVVAVKGLAGGYDYLANKLRDKWKRQEDALKPRRELSNAGGGASPASTAPNVTPKKIEARPLSMAEQLRQHKSGKRT